MKEKTGWGNSHSARLLPQEVWVPLGEEVDVVSQVDLPVGFHREQEPEPRNQVGEAVPRFAVDPQLVHLLVHEEGQDVLARRDEDDGQGVGPGGTESHRERDGQPDGGPGAGGR